MKKNKDKTILYIVSTLSFIFLGILITWIIDRTKTNDLRLRASGAKGISASASVANIAYDTNTIQINGLVFTSSPEKNMGTWTLTPPTSFNVGSVTLGSTVRLTIDPATVNISSHTLTAKEIKTK